MKPLDRNISILEHIVLYCQQIEQTVERFGNCRTSCCSLETNQSYAKYRST